MCKERFINPFTDFGFKKLFGTKGDEQSLISILNAVIDDGNPIESITYIPTEKLGIGQANRVAIFDLYCKTADGSHIIVEMQNNSQEFFVDRSIFYSSFPIQEAARKGKWDYQLPKIYTISFLNFCINELSRSIKYRSVVKLADIDTGEVFYDNLTYIYIELTKFRKKIDDLESQLDWWLYILKHLDQFDEAPKGMSDDVMIDFFASADIKRFSKDELMAYEESLKHLRDYQNCIDTAVKRNSEKARAKALAEGRAEGRAEEKREIAVKLKDMGMTSAEIAKITGIKETDF